MATSLYIDLVANRLVKSLYSVAPINPSGLIRGDVLDLNLYFLQPTGVTVAPYVSSDLSASSVKVAIGEKLALPTAGTWTLDSATLNYDATATQVQTALRTSQADASLTVTGSMADGFTVNWGSVGVEATLTGSSANLSPECDLTIAERRAGSASVIESQFVRVRLKPAAYQDTFTNTTTAVTATVSTLTGGSTTASEVQKIAFSPYATNGTWSITFPGDTRSVTAAVVAGVFTTTANHGFALNQTIEGSGFTNEANWVEGTHYFIKTVPSPTTFTISATSGGAALTTATADAGTGTITSHARTTSELAATASAADVQAALQAMSNIGSGNVSVIGTAGQDFTLSFIGDKILANFPAVTVSTTNLLAPYGKNASLTLATFQMSDILAAADSVVMSLEIQVVTGAYTTTVVSQDVTVTADLIDGATLTPLPVATLLSLFAATDFSTLPTSNPGSGKPWLNGGVLQVGA
jgi:hypothetical protein